MSQSGRFLQLILGVLLLFPFSSDPLRQIPADRLQSWPLSRSQRIGLRIASVWFSPVSWIAAALLIWASTPAFAAAFLALSLLFYALGAFFSAIPARAPALNVLRFIPAFGGSIGGLVRKNTRELLTTLDFYLAVIVCVIGIAYRVFMKPVEPDAVMMLSVLIVLALSTFALCLFGLDTESGFTRYRLLPLSGWHVLLAKDVPFMLTIALLTLPLAPLAGIAAGLMALTVGHYSSVKYRVPQKPWRFSGGASLGAGLGQAFLMFSAGTLASRTSSLVLFPCAMLFAGSLWHSGRILDRAEE